MKLQLVSTAAALWSCQGRIPALVENLTEQFDVQFGTLGNMDAQ